MYDFVYIIDFGNTSKSYNSCPSLNCSPMINCIKSIIYNSIFRC